MTTPLAEFTDLKNKTKRFVRCQDFEDFKKEMDENATVHQVEF